MPKLMTSNVKYVVITCDRITPHYSINIYKFQYVLFLIYFKQVKWSGAYQEGAGLTLGEEVEQVNAFLSRIAVTTKHMSKAGEMAKHGEFTEGLRNKWNSENILFSGAGRTDMLTLLSMRWNRQKNQSLATSLSHRFLKVITSLFDCVK